MKLLLAEKNVSRKGAKTQRSKGFPQISVIFILIMKLLLAEKNVSRKGAKNILCGSQ
jgi:hypothetical protein